MDVKKCTFCGKTILSVSKICKYCGKSLEKDTKEKMTEHISKEYRFSDVSDFSDTLPNSSSKRMFRNPFSFEGRIRRTEYGISCIITLFCRFLIILTCEILAWSNIYEDLLSLPIYFFFVAQGVKRCHDRNNSGWYQLIPFYIFWMLFGKGDDDANEYGKSPK